MGKQDLRYIPRRIRSNPIIAWTLRQPRKLAAVWWLISIMSLFGFVGSLYFKNGTVINGIVLIGGLSAVVNPFFGVWLATYITWNVSQLESNQTDLLFVTSLSDIKLVEGYVFLVLYRLRVSILFTLGLAPSVVIRLTDFAYNTYTRCVIYSSYCPHSISTAIFYRVLLNSTALLVAVGVCILGIVLGIALTLWWRSRFAAGLVTTILVIILSIFFINDSHVFVWDSDPVPRLILAIAHMLLIYAMAFAVVAATQLVVRRSI